MRRFPPGLEPVEDLSPSNWVQEALKDWPAGRFRVRDLVPPVFAAYARILHRPYQPSDERIPTGSWAERAADRGRELGPNTNWDELTGPNSEEGQRDDRAPGEGGLIEQEAESLVSFLSGHTSTPFECWFAMWSGWGDLSGGTAILTRARGRFPDWRARQRAAILARRERRAMARLATFEILGHSGRTYLLFEGSVADALKFRFGGSRFQSPALWWPEDRAWFVHTEIDETSTYLGGSQALVDQLVGEQILESFEVSEDSLAAL